MWQRRVVYLAAVLGSLVFYMLYREWISWIILLAVVLLPWFSLLLSLPAMLTVKANLRCPPKTQMQMPVRTALQLTCKFPVPPVGVTMRLVNTLNGHSYVGKPGELIPTQNCGLMTISYPCLFIYDYLGLFRKRLGLQERQEIFIEPKPVSVQQAMLPEGKAVSILKPKPGGGYSEIHDLRLYRPGDDLRQIHWKLAAKTGKLIYREPMEPARKGSVLTLTLTGTPEELDKKLGQLLWTSRNLLGSDIAHEVRCLTGTGVTAFRVTDEASLQKGMHILLGSQPAQCEAVVQTEDVLWKQHIGGDGYEG